MTDPTLIADLVRAGLDPELVQRVADAVTLRHVSSRDASRSVTVESVTPVTPKSKEAIRAKRYRDRKRDARHDASRRVTQGGYSSISPRLSLFQEEEEKNSLREKKEGVKEIARSAFDQFWQVYPNKVGKKDAERKFGSVMKSGVVTVEELMAGLDRYVRKTDDRPWCNPATWLHQHRWTDKPVQVKNGRKSLADAADELIERAEAFERSGSGNSDALWFGSGQDGKTVDLAVSEYQDRQPDDL